MSNEGPWDLEATEESLDEAEIAPGTVLDDKFRIERLLGMGGMGAVYEVTHLLTHHRRALKILHPEMLRSPDNVDRFLREASAAGKISNPHIVETFDAGRLESGEPFVMMELLKGESLRERLDGVEGVGLPLGEVIAIMSELCDGVEAAHNAGIVHRDLKPDNVFLVDGTTGTQVKVLDFGISKFDHRHTVLAHATAKGAFMGTPAYMSPEQFEDGAMVAASSDLYSLGVILYEMVSGVHPYPAESMLTLARKIVEGVTTAPSQHNPALPPAIDTLVFRALERDPSQRLTAGELGRALRDLAADKPADRHGDGEVVRAAAIRTAAVEDHFNTVRLESGVAQSTPPEATPTQATPTQATPTQATPTQATPPQVRSSPSDTAKFAANEHTHRRRGLGWQTSLGMAVVGVGALVWLVWGRPEVATKPTIVQHNEATNTVLVTASAATGSASAPSTPVVAPARPVADAPRTSPSTHPSASPIPTGTGLWADPDEWD